MSLSPYLDTLPFTLGLLGPDFCFDYVLYPCFPVVLLSESRIVAISMLVVNLDF